jgi:GNAT superfamily N-acetyltransferase
MRLLTFDELGPSQEAERALIQLSAFNGVFGRRLLERWRSGSEALTEYGGVFAVDRGVVVGQTFVLRLPYQFPDGPKDVSGIAAVATRPDLGHRGVARAVLDEVHRLEREAGRDHALLWTNRAWVAHRFYEKLGYRDIFAPSTAVSPSGAQKVPPTPPGVRRGRRTDADGMVELHQRMGRGRLGFVRRPKGMISVAIGTHELDPNEAILVVPGSRGIEGYAVLQADPYKVLCGELVARSERVRRRLIGAVERRAGRKATVFVQAPTLENAPELRRRGYTFLDSAWFVLMGRSGPGAVSERAQRRAFGTDTPRFRCDNGDRF